MMHRRSVFIGLLILALSAPVFASQFVELPFEQVASEAQYIVRGHIVDTWTAWDDAHEAIYTYATVRVTRYFGETTGPDTLVVREVGGVADGYTQEAIGFPMIRRGENVVLMLAPWADSSDMRIHAFNQGKYLVVNRGGGEVLVSDAVKQGDERLGRNNDSPFNAQSNSVDSGQPGLRIEEFAAMVDDARAGRQHSPARERQ
jgi:hypothetical protein